ncbi:hypothetical protein H5410_005349 [Solanum commersonii]|uniref:Uncharacterized protein n=1 Tax=Solanum commersonii TaxID=4109 RepID=A0A9J6A777_SOLCO|nr:hypothetical protein H5410_005349 [Solanum commersonii]
MSIRMIWFMCRPIIEEMWYSFFSFIPKFGGEESYQPQHFENVPNSTSSHVPMVLKTSDAINNLEDPNNQADDNYPKDGRKAVIQLFRMVNHQGAIS